MSFRRRHRVDALIDITPMVDLFLLLIVFFAMATTFAKVTRLGVDLPEAVGQPPPPVAHKIEVSVAESGEYSVNGLPLVDSQRETLRTAIADASARSGGHDIPFFLTADAKATHQSVVTVMDVAGELGFASLSIVTREPKR